MIRRILQRSPEHLAGSLKVGHGVQCLGAGPCFGRRAAHGGEDQAHGDAQFLLNHLCKEISDGSEASHCLRRGRNPFPLNNVHALARRVHVDGELAQKRVGGLRHLCFGTERILKNELHVGLAGGDPDFTDNDVGKSQFVFARNCHVKRSGCGVLQIEESQPLTGFIRFGRGRDAIE